MPRVDHKRHEKGLQGMKVAQQEAYRYEFHGAGEDGNAHQHGIPETEAGDIHIDPVSKAKKPEAGQNRNRMGKGRPKGLFLYRKGLHNGLLLALLLNLIRKLPAEAAAVIVV